MYNTYEYVGISEYAVTVKVPKTHFWQANKRKNIGRYLIWETYRIEASKK